MAKSNETLQDALNSVIASLESSADLLIKVTDMPFAEPDAPVWDEFHKQPYVHELVEIFGLIYDAKKEADKTLRQIKADAAA